MVIRIKPTEKAETVYVPGKYEALIQGVTQKVSKSGLDMLEIVFKGEFGKNAPKTITGRIIDNKIGREQLFNILKACGLEGEEAVEESELEGKYVGIIIAEGEPYNDKPTWNVFNYFTLEDSDDEEDEHSSEISEGWDNVSDDINSLTEMRMNFRHGISDEVKEDQLKQLKELISDGIFSLVIPEDREVSNKSINRLALPSNAVTGGYTGRNLAERLLINEYIGTYFADFTDDIKTPLSYELEYILNGKDSDRENLENTVADLLAIREGLNYMHIISDADKMQRAGELAEVISGVICLPEITFLIKFLIIAVWALVESAIDIKCLLSGGKVPIIKTKDDWKADLDTIFEVLENRALGNKDSERGINYEGYLKMLLYIEDPVKRNFRMMDIMQLDIGVSQNDFLMKDMIYGIDANISCGARRVFSEISYFSKEFAGLISGYEMQVKVEKIY